MRLINLKPTGKFVFVGDTHGDLDASEKVIKDYLKPRTRIGFLGDYVDRGTHSKENIEFLLKTKEQNPRKIYLLQGNHEGYCIEPVFPSDFWSNLNSIEEEKYSKIFEKLPLVICIGNIIALHGALPNINKLQEVNEITNGNGNWEKIVWGDFDSNNQKAEGKRDRYGRPQFGELYFNKIMERVDKKVLIRSHQPCLSERVFGNRCLTIFTSNAYGRKRTIAIADFDKKKKITSIDDLVIKEI